MSLRTLFAVVYRFYKWKARDLSDIIGVDAVDRLMQSGVGDGWLEGFEGRP